ncbi:MAG: ferrous iron transport protein A [Bacteroidota bacterium]
MLSEVGPLSSLSLGQIVRIDSFTDELVELKMLEMGVVPGETAIVERFAPAGDPMAIRISDALIGIRKTEADHIIVQKID